MTSREALQRIMNQIESLPDELGLVLIRVAARGTGWDLWWRRGDTVEQLTRALKRLGDPRCWRLELVFNRSAAGPGPGAEPVAADGDVAHG